MLHSPSLVLYWDRPFDETYTEAEGTLEYERRRAVRFSLFRSRAHSSEDTQRVASCSLTQVFDNDPVRTTSLTAYVAASLRDAEAACGGSAQLQSRWLAKAEPEVLKQIYDAVTGNRP